MAHHTPSRKAYFLIGIADLGWGLSTPFIEEGLKYMEPMLFLGLRFLFAGILLSPLIILKKRSSLNELIRNKWVWFIGLAEAFGLITQYFGQEQGIPAGLAALLSLLFLLIVPFISPWILNAPLKQNHFIAVIIGLIGVYFIATEGKVSNLAGGSIFGIQLLLSAAFGYAFYIVTTSRLTTIEKPNVDVFALFYIDLFIIAFSAFAVSILIRPTPNFQGINPLVWLWLGLLTVFSTIIAFLTYFEALKEISANSASVLLLL
ncbi:MAG: DMT family transporter, partial [Candidatus Kariarchaeaceae archaeon]